MSDNKINCKHFTGERALFQGKDLEFIDCIFDDGESPLKESQNISLTNCTFGWKYPLWYSRDVRVDNCLWTDTARAGVWYTTDAVIKNCKVLAPKNFRRCENLALINIELPNAQETLWGCSDVTLDNVKVRGNYFGMNCSRVTACDLELDGDYGFDGASDVVIRNSVLKTKDAFWNCQNVTVINSIIIGEYFGWNSKNITLINCKVQSLQGFCYIDGLKLVNCELDGTTLSFEYCKNIDADVVGVVNVKNPISGRIVADEIGELILEQDKVDTQKTEITIRGDK